MKLHLPHQLYCAVLACFAVTTIVTSALAEIPEGYTLVTIRNVTELGQYKGTDKIAFLIDSDINDTLYFMSGKYQYWTSANSDFSNTLAFSKLSTSGIHTLEMENFLSLSFRNNRSSENYGGAMRAYIISLTNNGDITFSENRASYHGGAIYGGDGVVNIENNGAISFNGNSADRDGGAIFGDNDATIILTNNGDVSFIDNRSSLSGSGEGGAIFVSLNSTVVLKNNRTITFSCNSSSGKGEYSYSDGGAIYGANDSTITLANNGEVSFNGNYAIASYGGSKGGAIYGGKSSIISLTNNGDISFEGNHAGYSSRSSSCGGAIYSGALSKIIIAGNDSVAFRGNYEWTNTQFYRLRSIYTQGSEIKLSAGTGQHITFYDPIYVSSGVTVCYNSSFDDANGGMLSGCGDVVFSGLYAKTDLAKLKSDYTTTELSESMTSEVYANARLYGGRLRIEDGAIYKGTGLITQTNSTARVVLNNGSLDLSGDLLINSGTAFEMRGTSNKITASSLTLNSGSTLSFVLDESHLTTAALTVTGDILKQKGELTLEISPDSVLAQDGAYQLMTSTTGTSFTNWDSTKITISGLPLSADSLRWSGGTLYLDYTVPMAWTGSFSDTWDAGTPNWSKYGADTTYADAQSVEFNNSASGTVQLVGTLTPKGVLVSSDTEHAYTFAGSGKLTGTMVLAKSGEGTLTIDTANDYTGGTAIYGGTLVAKQATALGAGKVQLSGGLLVISADNFSSGDIFLSGGSLMIGATGMKSEISAENTSALAIAGGVVWTPAAAITNSGSLTVSGDIDASALTLVTTGTDTHIDVQGNSGASGFEKLAERSVQLVNGGTTIGTAAHVTHRDLNEKLTLVLGADGVARAGGAVDYSNYLLTGSVVARSSAIHAVAGAEKAAITMQSGTLTVDDAAEVTATSGSLYLSGGTLSGTLNGVAVTATSGTIDAAFSGSSKLTGSKFALESALQNSGTLTLSGTFDISAMEMEHIEACRTDVNGKRGDSGFATGEGYAVQVVIGGTTVGTNATLTHGENTLKLDANGYASTALQTDYSNYLLTGSDAVTTAAVHAKSSAATITQTGGTLTVNDTATVTSTGGTILLANGTLNGGVSNATVSATSGTMNATLGGNTLLVGSNYALQKAITNSGTLTLNGSFSADALNLTTTAATHVDVNGISGASGFAKAGDSSVRVVNGGTVVNDNATVTHGSLSLTLGADGIARAVGATDYRTYTLTGSGVVTSSAIHAFNTAATVTMNGGTLVADDAVSVTATGGSLALQGGCISGSLQNVSVTASSGNIQTAFAGNSTLVGQSYALNGTILNSGTLTLRGSFAADNLTLRHLDATRVDVNGNSGTSGFAKDEAYAVTLVNGGTVVNGGTTVTHGIHTLVLGADGVATEGGAVNYGNYLLVSGASATTSAIHAFNAAAGVTMSGGFLTVDDGAAVTATGGMLTLNGGLLNGTLNNVTLTANGGSLSATLGGTTTLTGNQYRLTSALMNEGTLIMGGSFDVSNLQLNTTEATHVDVNGKSGASGFAKYGDSSVTLVNGGTVINNNAVVKHGSLTLTLDADGIARATGTTVYSEYLLTGSDSVTTAAVHGKSSTASITQTGGTLTVNDTATVNASAGNIALTGGTLNGTLSGTSITATGGTLAATLNGANTLNGSSYALKNVISNSGTLTMSGSFNANALTLNTTAATHVDVNGNSGASGFAKDAAYSVQLVNGGTVVNNGATVTHGTHNLTLSSNGTATEGGAIHYDTYLLTGTATATTSAIHGKSSSAAVTQTGGTLTVNDTATVNATAGKLTLSGGTLNGTLSGTTITATSGTIAAALNGTNTLNGSSYALKNVIANNGTLTIGGTFDVSALTLNTTAATHVDVNGKSGASGFAKTAAYAVQVVNGGSTVNNGATIKHGTRTLTLNSDGTATTGGVVDYSNYLLTGNDTVSVSAIRGKSSTASITQTGGTLTANGTASVNTTGGNISLTSGTLSGTVSNAAVTASGGTLKAALSGNNTISGQNYTLGSVISNTGVLTMSGAFNASALTLNTTAASHVDVNGNSGASGFAKDAAYSVKLVSGGTVVNNGATVTHGTRTLELGGNGIATAGGDVHYDNYLLTGTGTATSSAIHGVSSTAAITQTGGTLTVDDTATVNATAGNIILQGGTLKGQLNNTALTAKGGTVAADIRGGKTVSIEGNVALNGYVAADISLNSGRLTTDTLDLESGQSLIFNGGRLTADVTTADGSEMVLNRNAVLNGDLTLDGGELVLNGNMLTVDGTLNLFNSTEVDISELGIGEYKLLTFGDLNGSLDNLNVHSELYRTEWSRVDNALMLEIRAMNDRLHWTAASGTWKNGARFGEGVFDAEDDVFFASPATVTISGAVAPGQVMVENATGTVTLKAANTSSRIVGETALTKNGTGALVLNNGNTYTGGTTINAGTVTAGGVTAFGAGEITVNGGTLNLGKYAVTNPITVNGAANLKGTAYKGALTINADLGTGTNFYLGKTAVLNSGKVSGVLTGAAGVSVKGEGTLAGKNTYKGTTAVQAGGLLHLTGTVAGNISVSGTLDSSTRTLTPASGKTLTVNNGGVVHGLVNVASGRTLVMKGTESAVDTINLNAGTAVFDSTAAAQVFSGTGVFSMNGHAVNLKTKSTVKSAADTPMTLESGSITLTSSKGYAGPITLNGGTLNLGKIALASPVTVDGTANLIGSAYKGALTVNGTLAGSSNVYLGKTATLDGGTVKGILKGKGGVIVRGESTLANKNTYTGTTNIQSGALLHLSGSVAGNIVVNSDATLDNTKTVSLTKGKTMKVMDDATVTGGISVGSGATLAVYGEASKLGAVSANGGTVVLDSTAAAVVGTGTAALTVHGKNLTVKAKSTLKMATDDDITLRGGKLVLNSTSSTYTGDLLAQGGTLDLASRAIKNDVYLGNAALMNGNALRGTLHVQDANSRYSGSLTLTSAQKLDFEAGSKLTVSGTLTLKGGTALTLSGDDWEEGEYTLISCGKLSGKAATAFKVTGAEGFDSSIRSSGKNIILTLTTAADLELTTAPERTTSCDVLAEPERTTAAEAQPLALALEEEEADTLTAAAYADTYAAMQEHAPLADALAQSDWALLDTTRAFTASIRNRSMGTLTQDGKGAIWANAVGSFSRRGSVNNHSGSQTNVYGGSIGAERVFGEHHTLGVALGSTHAMVGGTSLGKLRQDATHLAVYGNSRMGSNFSADWAAAFGTAVIHGNMGALRGKWEQNSGELTARVTYTETLSEHTALRTFAGLDYDATGADRVNGYKTGSVQALRGELGVGLTHATENAVLYAEVGLVGDMVRHNPTVACGQFRLQGANPGRTGFRATLGGSIKLNDTWSANAAYNIETAADSTVQSVNVGVSRKF